MTTLILVTIGILLAGAAALMTVWYGGDAFDAGDAKAQADQLMNSGTNVRQAANLYMVRHGKLPADATELAKRAVKQMPAVHGIGTTQNAWMELSAENSRVAKAYAVTGVRDDVCRIVNENAIGGSRKSAILERPEGLTGCFRQNGSNTYYAMLSAAAPRVGARARDLACQNPQSNPGPDQPFYYSCNVAEYMIPGIKSYLTTTFGSTTNPPDDYVIPGFSNDIISYALYKPYGGRFGDKAYVTLYLNVDMGSPFCRQWNASVNKPYGAENCSNWYSNKIVIHLTQTWTGGG